MSAELPLTDAGKFTKEVFTESGVASVLAKHFAPPHFAFLTQVRNGTGYTKKTRTADALAMSLWPSRGLHLHGIEIKVSLSDFRRELADPAKAEDIAKHCHFWWVAAPNDKVIPPNLVPANWGLILIDPEKNPVVVRNAEFKQATPPDHSMLAAILRNVAESTLPKDSLRDWQNQVERRAGEIAMDSHRTTSAELARALTAEKDKVHRIEQLLGCQIARWDGGAQFTRIFKLAQALDMNSRPLVSELDRLLEIVERFKQPLADVKASIEQATAPQPPPREAGQEAR